MAPWARSQVIAHHYGARMTCECVAKDVKRGRDYCPERMRQRLISVTGPTGAETAGVSASTGGWPAVDVAADDVAADDVLADDAPAGDLPADDAPADDLPADESGASAGSPLSGPGGVEELEAVPDMSTS